ncbi:MAG: hypothetical protein KatS3mg118_3487 [Paracoccaceae bacterium]|nr:MAG: hypothetical protein KatS3mg118_3487 [Paracoccaceae bacterium]
MRDSATEPGVLRLDQMALIGVFGASGSRRALIRLPDGSFRRLARGDRIEGWRVTAIDTDSLRLARGAETRILRLPR